MRAALLMDTRAMFLGMQIQMPLEVVRPSVVAAAREMAMRLMGTMMMKTEHQLPGLPTTMMRGHLCFNY